MILKKINWILIIIILLAAALRLWNLVDYPAGFNADEAALGYNAYSLIQTGKDEYGINWPLVFKSFDDYKPGLYVYLTLPFVAILGLNELAVRLPSAILGILNVVVIYYLAKRLFALPIVAPLAGLLLAISPWHLHYSRGGWESNAATFAISLGVLLYLKARQQTWWLLPSMVAFLAAMYLYQGPRLVAPVLVVGLGLIDFKHWWKVRRQLIGPVIVSFIVAMPLIMQIVSGGGGGASERFNGLSFYSDPGPTLRTNELRGQHDDPSSLIVELLHNKITAYAPVLWSHYLDHFNPDFWFINGDPIIRNKVPSVGQFYIITALFWIIGGLALVKKTNDSLKVLAIWILVAPLASSLTFQTPNALRSLSLVVPVILVMAYGLGLILQWANQQKLWRWLIVLLVIGGLTYETGHYLNQYYQHYPKRYPLAWEYGFKEMVTKLVIYQDQYQEVIVTDRYDQPYILTLFYLGYDPAKYQPQAIISPRDKFNFGTVRQFDKYRFRPVTEDEIKSSTNKLFIASPEEVPAGSQIIDQVLYPNGQPAFVFIST